MCVVVFLRYVVRLSVSLVYMNGQIFVDMHPWCNGFAGDIEAFVLACFVRGGE